MIDSKMLTLSLICQHNLFQEVLTKRNIIIEELTKVDETKGY
jgi:hypothetical protein